MTTYYNEKKICGVCRKKSKHQVLESTNAFGSPDLDTRPPQMQRSTMYAWVQHCPKCGYCSSDIAVSSENLNVIIKGEEYQAQLKDRSFSDLAISFLCKAMIAEKEKRFSEAAWSTIHAVWSCDDAGNMESAKKCRLKAFRLIKVALEEGEQFVDQDGGEIAIMTDLLRRSGLFREASDIISRNQDKLKDDNIRKILAFQVKLISQSDTKCYLMSDALENNSIA